MSLELKYPLEDNDYKARVLFTCYKENRPTITQEALNLASSFNIRSQLSELFTDDTDAEARDKAAAAAQASDENPDLQPVKGDRKVTKSNLAKVHMYMPQQVQFADRAEYTNVDLGIVGSGVVAGMRNSATGLDMAKNMLKSALPSREAISDLLNQGLTSEAAQIAALRLTRFSEGVQGAIETETGLTINPNRRATFKGVGLRRFNFNFGMVPTSQRESNQIKQIVGLFREQVYPELASPIPGTNGQLSAGLRFPNKWQVKLQYLINGRYTDILGLILPCFLENVSVTYNPNAMAFHADGEPQETQISLSFLEERAINKNDVKKENQLFFNGLKLPGENSVQSSLRPRARPGSVQLPEVPI